MLVGRGAELLLLADLVDRVRSGGSATLLIRGEPGVGKTALLDGLAQLAEGFLVIRIEGIESELQLDYAALHRVVLPFMDRMGRLHAPQREALEAALGLSASGRSDRFLVGLAVLGLVGDTERSAPLLIVIDDAHWLDQDSMAALAFVGRRLQADRVALVFAVRDSLAATLPTLGLPELLVLGLEEESARELLSSLVSTPITDRVVTDVVAATKGNPLALAGLAEELTASQLSGLSPLPDPLPAGEMIEARFARQIQLLPRPTQMALLVAAAEPTQDLLTIGKAAEEMGASLAALEAAEVEQLISTESGIEFRHPLIRSAVYSSASSVRRRSAHRALATVLDGTADRGRWAMHRALAAVGPDEEVAAALEESATDARGRGGYTAETALLVRAADLTPGPRDRSRRLLAAAHAAYLAGNPAHAYTLLEVARQGELDELDRARAQVLDGTIRVPLGEAARTPALLLQAARSLAPYDERLSRAALLGSFNALFTAFQWVDEVSGRELGEAALAALEGGAGDPTVDALLRAAASAYVCDYPTAALALRQALATLERMSAPEVAEWHYVCMFVPQELWDPVAYRFIVTRMETATREHGALLALIPALLGLASAEIREGHFSAARTRYAEMLDITHAVGGFTPFYALLDVELVAWEGDETVARSKISKLIENGEAFSSGASILLARFALALLELSLGRYAEALNALEVFREGHPPVWPYLVLPLIVEAATRCGETQVAAEALEEVVERAHAVETPYAMGLLWRCRALAGDDAETESAFDAALAWLEQTPWRTESARTHLLYGEWLRRQKRRTEARIQLRTAHETFELMGAKVFAERARLELHATGERARKRSVEAAADLTVRELQIARLAAERLTSREIASRLFISPHTVEYHLKKVFQKLGITSRRDLATALPLGVGIHG